MDFKGSDKVAIFNIDISKAENGVFVQTNFIKSNNDIKPMSYAEYLDISEIDAKELAETLSYVCRTTYEDKDNFCTVYIDGEVVEEYKNE